MLWHVPPAGMMVSAKTGRRSNLKFARLALKIASFHWDRMVTGISWMLRAVPKTQAMTLRWEAVCISLKTLASNTRSTRKFAFVIRTNVTVTDAVPSFVAALFPIPIIVETSRNVSIHHCVSHDSRWMGLYLTIPSHKISSVQNPRRIIPSHRNPLGSKSPRTKSPSSQNPLAQNPRWRKIPAFSKSPRAKSPRSQNPLAQNPQVLKIPSLKIP